MGEIESVTSYWEEFFKTHPDPTELRFLVAEDPVLTKVFNFSSVPWIWNGLEEYPFEAKKAELKTIPKGDKEYLAKRCFQADAKQVEWLDYLSNLFDAYSDGMWPLIPIQGGQSFRRNLATPEGIIEAALDNPC